MKSTAHVFPGNEIRSFPIKPSPKASVWAGIIALFLVILSVYLAMTLGGVAWAVIPWTGGAALLVGYIAIGLQKVRFEVSQKGLRIRGDMWGQSLSWNELDLGNARLINFGSEDGLKLKWKTCGTGLPGYAAGWFRLRNKGKALVFLTDDTEAVYIPTRKDFSVLLSSENNPALLQAIQQCGKV